MNKQGLLQSVNAPQDIPQKSVNAVPSEWHNCLVALQDQLSSDDYAMWIRPLTAYIKNDTLFLGTPNDHFTKHVKQFFLKNIVDFVGLYSEGRLKSVKIDAAYDNKDDVAPKKTQDELALPDEDNNYELVATNLPSLTKRTKKILPSTIHSLNKHFTFDEFVEGKSNQMALAAAKEVVNALGSNSHNPFFIYGPTGLGKTHLMHAVGHVISQLKPNAKIAYLTSEQFVMYYVSSIRKGQMDQFKHECRQLDLLLVDDIHLLAGKDNSINEFFHTFNALIDDNKQIILTSDRYPKELTELDPRLISRFSWGLSVAVEPPDIQTRIDILLKKAESMQVILPANAAHFIAQNVIANVRELEGALNRIVALARFKGTLIDDVIAKEALKDVIIIRARHVGIDNIQKTVCEYYGIPLKELIGAKRSRAIARPRQIAMGLARELTGKSYPDIGKSFGGRDHSTVMHACEKVEALKEVELTLADDYKNLLRLLQN